ncbi:APC family permease [Acidimangrovimonas sediminis]|uniref:APC family permease n=1 Tax=Acidimangrovimonas sediminis TaxID=2056283 RepID=UPI001304CA77|nr:APC family permease [Acidimangrovimonas sediminis]
MADVAPSEAHLRKDAGPIGLMFASVSAMIGSGWLFASLHAAKIAGPNAIWSWVVGAIAVLLLALVFSEITTMMPKSGALVHMSYVSHGTMVGRVWGWLLFFAYASVAPVEVEAVLTYANNYLPGLVDPQSGVLTSTGFIWALIILAIFVGLNFMVVKYVLMVNTAATWWKIAIPLITVLVLVSLSFHGSNFTETKGDGGFAAIFEAVPAAGVIFSLLGFRQAIDMAGETANPSRNIPVAVIGSVFLSTVVYILLQIAFIGALDPKDIAGGWSTLHFAGAMGPLAAISVTVGAAWWATILYADAIISPGATGFIYSTATSRVAMAGGEMKSLPPILAKINGNGVPVVALIVTYVVGVIFFFPFPAWQKLVEIISSLTVLTYGIGAVVLLHLRRTSPDATRPFFLKGAWIIAPLSFIVSTWIIQWTGLDKTSYLFGAILILFVIYVIYYYATGKQHQQPFGWETGWWLIPYFAGLWLLSYFGPTTFDGQGLMTFPVSLLVGAIFSVVILWLALMVGMSPEDTEGYLKHIAVKEHPGKG